MVYGKWISFHPGVGVGAGFVTVAAKRAAASGGVAGPEPPSGCWWKTAPQRLCLQPNPACKGLELV